MTNSQYTHLTVKFSPSWLATPTLCILTNFKDKLFTSYDSIRKLMIQFGNSELGQLNYYFNEI